MCTFISSLVWTLTTRDQSAVASTLVVNTPRQPEHGQQLSWPLLLLLQYTVRTGAVLDVLLPLVLPPPLRPLSLLLFLLLQHLQYLVHPVLHNRLASLGATKKVMLLVTALALWYV